MIEFFTFMVQNIDQIIDLTIEHIRMTAIAVGISVLIGVPVGILVGYFRRLNKPIIGIANVVQAIPSMALLGLFIPLLGIGMLPAIVMVIIYSLLPIIKNTYTGIASIDPQLVEAASAIGLTKGQVLMRVKLPMALPVIMAGIRISTVTAVGTMTMAAYIGAGGLGYLIFAGIRTVNMSQILAGAIPACILALILDFVMGSIEKLVTPKSLLKDFQKIAGTKAMRRRKEKITLGVVAAVVVIIIINGVASVDRTSEKTLTIAGKDYTEQFILCNLYADYIEDKTDISVERVENLGGSTAAYEALVSHEIDMYIDYTGTIYGSIYSHSGETDMDVVYEICKEDYAEEGVTLLNACEFNNTYTLSIRTEDAEKYNIYTIADLDKYASQFVLGSTIEFQNRDDTMAALQKVYTMEFKDMIAVDGSPRYTALMNYEVDVIDAYATDGMLKKYDITILEDTDQVFPPYNGVPCLTDEILEEYPELEDVVNELSSYLTNDVMQELNYGVDVEEREPADVAHEWLVEQGLIEE